MKTSFSMAFALALVLTFTSAQAQPQPPAYIGKTLRLGLADAGTLPTALVGGCVYDAQAQRPLCSDGGSWSELHPSLAEFCGDGGTALGWTGNAYTCTPTGGSSGSGTLANNYAIPSNPSASNTLLAAMGVGTAGGAQGSLLNAVNSDGYTISLMGPHGGARCNDIGAPANSPNLPVTAIGSTSVPAPATTNYVTQLPVQGQQTTSTADNQWVGVYQGGANPYGYWRGNAAGLGGFLYRTRVGFCSADTDQRAFFGLWATYTGISGAVEPSAQLDSVYVGCDSGDTNMSICSNDNSGSATCTTLGASFPCKTNNTVFDIAFYSPPNGSSIGYAVRRMDTAAFTSGTISSDLPRNSVFLNYVNEVSNGVTGGTAACIILIDSCFFTP